MGRYASFTRANEVVRSLNVTGRTLFYIFVALIIGSAAGLLFLLNSAFMTTVPLRGGSYTEGIVGTPRFINPILAVSSADDDLTSLIYSGLLKAQNGAFVPNLAESYTVSPDGKTYTVNIRPSATFQDGTPVTAADVVFTVDKALDPALKSPLRADWDGITATAIDAHTVQFTLPKPYAPFVQNLTVGILPKHLWGNVSDAEFAFSILNTEPVGSGPYEIDSIAHSASGIPQSYTLKPNPHYALGEPYIAHFILKFYQSQVDLLRGVQSGAVEGASGLAPSMIASIPNHRVMTVPLSRIFGVFFNQNQNAVLEDQDVRKALSDAIDRTDLIKSVLSGYGKPLYGPIPPSLYHATTSTDFEASSTAEQTASSTPLMAREELLQDGWKLSSSGILTKPASSGTTQGTQTLALTLTTGNVPELTAAAQYVKAAWEKMGADVNVQVFDQGDLSENVIRPRQYDALLFGEIVGRGLDLFAFWDSSERNDPGLNIAMYANANVDDLLEQLRATTSSSTRQALYGEITDQINADVPAVFLYAPDFIYVVPQKLQGVELSFIDNPSDRFEDVAHWYIDTDHVWKIFNRQQL